MIRGIHNTAIYELQRSLGFNESPLWPVGIYLWDFAVSDLVLHRTPEICAKNLAMIF